MGAVKSIPVVSEVVTAGESVGKLVGAAGCAVVGNTTDAKKLLDGAGQAWVDYTERQPIAAGINVAVRAACDDTEGVERVAKKLGHSYLELMDGTPGVGHVKGAVHYALGDKEGGDKCMKDASKGAVVIAATALTAATGGAAAPLLAGAASLVSGAAMDGIITGVDSAVHGEYRPHGEIAAVTQAVKTGDPNDIADAVLAPIADFGLAAASEFATAKVNPKLKNWRQRKRGQLEHHNLAREAADHIKKAYKEGEGLPPLSKKMKQNHGVATVVKDMKTGKKHKGYSAKPRQRMQHKVANEMNARNYKSSLQKRVDFPENHKNPIGRRPQNCAEHQAYEGYFKNKQLSDKAQNAIEVSVQRTNGRVLIVKRCNNCSQFAEVMGSVRLDLIGKDMTSARWNFLRSAVYGIQVAGIACIEIAWRGGNYIMIANAPAENCSRVEKIIVYTSKDNQCISTIQFVLSDGHCSELGKKSDHDEKEEAHLVPGEYVTKVVIEEKEKKVIGLAVSINEDERQIIFGDIDDELSAQHCFQVPQSQHLIGLYEGCEDTVIVAYAKK